jgi:hypothetical protein
MAADILTFWHESGLGHVRTVYLAANKMKADTQKLNALRANIFYCSKM